jgi:hypothetical protein
VLHHARPPLLQLTRFVCFTCTNLARAKTDTPGLIQANLGLFAPARIVTTSRLHAFPVHITLIGSRLFSAHQHRYVPTKHITQLHAYDFLLHATISRDKSTSCMHAPGINSVTRAPGAPCFHHLLIRVCRMESYSNTTLSTLPECVSVPSALRCTECEMSDTRYKYIFTECTRYSK